MRNAYKIIRFIVVSLLIMTVGIPAILYLVLWISPVRTMIRDLAESELSQLLGVQVGIRSVEIEPFTRLNIDGISVCDSAGRTVAEVQRISGGISPTRLIAMRRLVVDDVEIIGPTLCLWRDSIHAPLNIAPIIARLKSSPDSDNDKRFSLSLHTAVVRQGALSYNVLDRPMPEDGRFSPDHVVIRDLKADVAMPKISDRDMTIHLKRLQARESSGFQLKDLRGSVRFTDSLLAVTGLGLELPVTKLLFSDMEVRYQSADSLVSALASGSHTVAIEKGSTIYPPDFAPFLPMLSRLDVPVSVEASVRSDNGDFKLQKLELKAAGHDNGSLLTHGFVDDVMRQGNASAGVGALELTLPASGALSVANFFPDAPSALARVIAAMGRIDISGSAGAGAADGGYAQVVCRVASDAGVLQMDINAGFGDEKSVEAKVSGEEIDLGAMTGDGRLGTVDFSAALSGRMSGRSRRSGEVSVVVPRLNVNGHDYTDITADAALNGNKLELTAEIVDELLGVYVDGSVALPDRDNPRPDVKLYTLVDHADLCAMGLWGKFPGYSLTAEVDADLKEISPRGTMGSLVVSNFSFANRQTGSSIALGPLTVSSLRDRGGEAVVELKSDLLEARLAGEYDFAALPAELYALIFGKSDLETRRNKFNITGHIFPEPEFYDFFQIPVKPKHIATIGAGVDSTRAWFMFSGPYLQRGNKLLKQTSVNVSLARRIDLLASTMMKTKDGYASLKFGIVGDSISDTRSNLSWRIDRDRDFYGDIVVDTRLSTDPDNGRVVGAGMRIHPSELVVNDSVWQVDPATVAWADGKITVDGLHIGRLNQSVDIAGVAAPDSASRLDVALKNINLDYIFETLDLGDNLMFGGVATGNVSGHALLSSSPILRTDDLAVSRFSYSGGCFGEAAITARWDNGRQAIILNADVEQDNGRTTSVDGLIAPKSPGVLDFTFHADHTPVAFLRKLLSAFASDVTGEASGLMRLYGSFKKVQMAGALKPHDFGLTVAATNCAYFTEDSVILTPGTISLKDMTIRDFRGRTAKLDGRVSHNYLKDVSFDFRVHNARRFLVYDTRPSDLDNWHGRIFGSGSARIYGMPGVVNVEASISTDPDSEFTFTLSDREQAGEYSFLSFRDRNAVRHTDVMSLKPGSPELDRIMEDEVKSEVAAATATAFNMDLKVAVNPSARINLIMDPVSGDKITAYGSGSPNIIYNSSKDDFKIFGDYTIERGDYHFTLQDIIIKNFIIENGSKVLFRGDLDHINLDINAIYALKANLSDLDESFLNDKEVGRTSVTVQALLKVDGAISAPNIGFDLRFPTLTSDVDRKVHAIVSTKEMMNRQIIYLLALNRFYTPDYMMSTSGNRGGELVSVASSTISSQLSNILGQISDKFTLAPNLRSDAGDFSDVEFDLALSSTLLNNRLLLNGNFGYRDQMLNNNQFVGDFDIEYLLNRGGNWRLKAYNHFNDRNLYVKTAMTTQGLGLVFKHDFDSFGNFFRRKKHRREEPTERVEPQN